MELTFPESVFSPVGNCFDAKSFGTMRDVDTACISSNRMFHDDPVNTGTTIVAVSCKGGVVMGADTRTSAGTFVTNRVARKISKLHHRIFVCRSGSAADTQAITQYVKLRLRAHSVELGGFPSIKTAATLMQSICYQYKDYLTAGMIVAGWDPSCMRNSSGNMNDIDTDNSCNYCGEIYSIPVGGSLIKVKYAAGGSGSVFISSFMDEHFRDGMTAEECKDLIKKAIAYAISWDGSSGGMIRLVSINEHEVTEECVLGNNVSQLIG